MQTRKPKNLWPLTEYALFAAPYWALPAMCTLGLLWLIANKSQWDRIPMSLWMIFGSVTGLIALTRVLFRRQVGKFSIGFPTAAMLLIGLASCLYPAMSWEPSHGSREFSIACMWPLPIFVHWLVSGLKHRLDGSE